MPRDPVKNRANARNHYYRRKERTKTILWEFCQYVKREPLNDDFGRLAGYAYKVLVPEEYYKRFEELALEHGRTTQQLLDDCMRVYFEELQRLKDEQN